MPRPVIFALLFALAGLASRPARAAAGQSDPPSAMGLCQAQGVTGGLVVLVGGGEARWAGELAGTGRYLVECLEADPAAIARMRSALDAKGLYGLASVEALDAGGKLPYTENLVNAIFLGDDAAGGVSVKEALRVLAPGGVLFTKDKAPDGAWNPVRKPRPDGMDAWTHARHAADGNAVSGDVLAGPPRRVRWLAGPPQEICDMVTAGGRAYYAGVLTRDAFNGLRLWQRKLTPSPARGGWYFQGVGGSVLPIAAPDGVLVLTDKALQVLDAATGQALRQYPQAGLPNDVLLSGGTILAIDRESVRALDYQTARLLWTQPVPAPRSAVAGDDLAFYIQGGPPSPDALALVCRRLADGKPLWQHSPADLPWLPKVRRLVYHAGVLACEVSTLNEIKVGNSVQVVSADDGKPLWGREFIPHASHFRQARAMFAGDLLWVMDEAAKGCAGLDPRTGEVRKTWPTGRTHCFPPVATARYMLGGEMDWTDLATGLIESSHITKPACSRDAGVVVANGLLYAFPKRCICWPMLRDYAALAPALPAGEPKWDDLRFVPEPGTARAPAPATNDNPAPDWPCYRHDAWRSARGVADLPKNLKILWTADLGGWPAGPITDDWRDNYFCRGPVGPPVSAGGMVFVARPNAHQVVALDAATGKSRWTFTANGRVDTAPTIDDGLCLFGCRSGWVFALRAGDGQLVWRLRAAPTDERIVAHAQLESPWPVSGSVLVIGHTAYFAAGRQALADGGIFVFAVDPATGRPRWVKRLDSVPQKDFYASSAMDFESFDLLAREGDQVAMSRWQFDRKTGQMTCDEKSGYARVATWPGAGGVLVPRGSWSYAPPYESETWLERPFVRPLVAFAGDTLWGCSQDRRTVYRRDFRLDAGDAFDTTWIGKGVFNAKYGRLWRSQLLARDAAWKTVPFPLSEGLHAISAMLLAGERLYVASSRGSLAVLDAKDGRVLSRLAIPPPAWDSLAAAGGRLLLSTQDGQVVCLGGSE